jgi:hypothetical protein
VGNRKCRVINRNEGVLGRSAEVLNISVGYVNCADTVRVILGYEIY